ncbi:MAG: hypothetical protein QOF55_1899 [Thermoleophilaceae bacterium]|nr:hypothetical protein [Thermoleophilaceae bacterium]
MNLFVVAWAERPIDAALPERALSDVLGRLPFFPGRPVQGWADESGRCAAAWVAHEGLDYVHAEPGRLALFAGRPILWTGDTRADGRAPLDPRFYLDHHFATSELDGRFAAARFADGKLEVTSDRLGAYPLYATEVGGVRLVSNNAEALRAARGGSSMSAPVLASLLGGGWSLTGDPVWDGVHRIPPPALATGVAQMLGAGFEPERAAANAAASVRALADWPGRPSVVPVTGGRDSRLVLGAALAAGIDFTTTTGGEPGQPDVEIGRRLAQAAGVPHSVLEHDPHGSVMTDWRRAAELLSLTTSGTSSLSDAAGFPFGPRPGPLVLWHSGQGGEVARAYYGLGERLDRDSLIERQYRAFVARRPGRTEMIGSQGQRLVREQIGQFVDEQLGAGVAPVDVPDMFYLQRRMGTWAGPSHGAVEFVRDTTSPLWSHRLLRDELGLPAGDRARELFHLRVLERLAPQLVDIPFEDDRPWPARQSDLARRVQRGRVLARKVRGEVLRRARAARAPSPPGEDPFARVLPEIRDAVLSQPGHDAWQVLDRARVEALLRSPAGALDTMSRYYAWRLATVFGPTA